MKRLMLAIAATAAFVSVASAEKAWFTGTIGIESAGNWTMTPGDGKITTNNTTLVIEDAAASFAATSPKSLSGSANLNFATSAKFAYSYDELPEIDSGAKAGVVVYTHEYYVLAKDDTTNNWAATGIAAASLDSDVAVSVTISNDNSRVFAIYNIAGSVINKEVVAGDSAWGTVDYKGSGEVASLVGTTILLGYPIGPGHDPIPTDVGNEWAEEYGITPDKIAEVLASTQTFKGGRTAAESCLLGVGTNYDVVAEIKDTKSAKLELAVHCTPVAGRATFTLKKDGDVVVSGQGSASFEYDLSDGVYTVVAHVDGASKELPVSQEIGVKGTSVAAEAVYFIGAPYAECAIADLFKKTCCTAGDKVEVYDAENDKYLTWQFTGGAWVYADTGDAPSIKKGQAVKYTPAAAGTLYQIGNVSAATTTEIVAGGAEGDNWNLVASPKGSIKVSKLPLDGTKARALVLGDVDGITPLKIYLKVGGNLYVKEGWTAEATPVEDDPVLEGGFFLKTKEAVEIDWNADK